MDVAKVYREQTVKKTRKDHKCCECRQVIPVGSPCKKADGIWEWGAKTFRWCLTCDVLRREVMNLIDFDYEEPLCFGELHSFIKDLSRDVVV